MKTQFEVDKWYKDQNSNVYIKYQGEYAADDMYLYSKEAIVDGKYIYKKDDYWLAAGVRCWVLVNNSEVSEYLPDGHPDKVTEFKKGDYIVVLKLGSVTTACAKENYCFKQREDDECLSPVCDLDGDKSNANQTLTFDKSDRLLDWRYATKEEIAKYNKIGKPYDVTILNKSTMTTPEELLEKAKREYPIGTEYIGLRDNEPYTARLSPSWVPKGCNDYFGIQVGTDYVYRDGKWAEIVIPEYVECVYSDGGKFIVGKIYSGWPNLINENGSIVPNLLLNGNIWKFKPSTKEAFEKQNNKTVMSKQKLTVPVTDVLKIHSIACNAWKSKIAADYLPRVNAKQEIKFTHSEVDSMFKSATASQLPVLEEVFGKQSKPIDWDKIKTGSQVMIKYSGDHCGGFGAIDTSKPVTVIFFNTPHMIMSNGTFLPNGANPKYCTFNQGGKFVFFTSEDEAYKNYIVEVIQY